MPAPPRPTAQVTLRVTEDYRPGQTSPSAWLSWQSTAGAEAVTILYAQTDNGVPPLQDGQTPYCGIDESSYDPTLDPLDPTRVGTSDWHCVTRGFPNGPTRVTNLQYGARYRFVAIPDNDFRTGMYQYSQTVTPQNAVNFVAYAGVRTPSMPVELAVVLGAVLLALGVARTARPRGRRA